MPEWASKLSPCEPEASFKNISAPFYPVPILPQNTYNADLLANPCLPVKMPSAWAHFRARHPGLQCAVVYWRVRATYCPHTWHEERSRNIHVWVNKSCFVWAQSISWEEETSSLLCPHVWYLYGIMTWRGPLVLLPWRCSVCSRDSSCWNWVSGTVLINAPQHSSGHPSVLADFIQKCILTRECLPTPKHPLLHVLQVQEGRRAGAAPASC